MGNLRRSKKTGCRITGMHYTIQQIAGIISATASIQNDIAIEHLLLDSRKILFPHNSLFFALSSSRRNGHQFVQEVYERGVRNFVVEQSFKKEIAGYHDANFLVVQNSLEALQQLAAYHRKQFNYPVIGITGSNGKTIVKEWLYQLLQNEYHIVRSPRSYNSQIGVPLSMWQMSKQYNLGIFEAGISTRNEMRQLQNIIQPTIGILTNIGNAHDDGFLNSEEKIKEKLQLFVNCEWLILPDDITIQQAVSQITKARTISWGKANTADLQIVKCAAIENNTTIHAVYKEKGISITIPFTDAASIDNACVCWLLMLEFGFDNTIVQRQMLQLHTVEMRMQLLNISNNCVLVNDSYSNDVSSFHIALDYLLANAGNKSKTIILSDFSGIGKSDAKAYGQLADTLHHKQITKLIGIGEIIGSFAALFGAKGIQSVFFESTQAFLNNFTTNHFRDEYILLKGGRAFNFERIAKWLQHKTHQTIMEINLTALVHNLKEYQKHLLPSTKTMAMVKAFSYGSGSVEVARVLQFHKVDYLAVAYTDEGIDLRRAGISLPIMILNVEEENFDALIEYNLEPEVFSFSIFHQLHQYLLQQGINDFPVHIKFNTGMNRLGFEVGDAATLGTLLYSNKTMLVKSVLSHLAASEAPEHDAFTKQQQAGFEEACKKLEENIGYTFIKHIANSAAIFRHPSAQYDMVRLGIGLYGVDSAAEDKVQLQTVASLKTTIAQIRTLKAGETVGYNRRGVMLKDSKIATVRIGYADGLSRALGNGKGFMYLHGKLAPVVGSVCMDMTMIDITNIPEAAENDDVEIFGKYLPVQQLAGWYNTIAYETLSCVSQRVRRVYVEE